MSNYFGQLVRINSKAPCFAGELAYVAYIGPKGVSVYLKDHPIDDCITLENGEFDAEECEYERRKELE